MKFTLIKNYIKIMLTGKRQRSMTPSTENAVEVLLDLAVMASAKSAKHHAILDKEFRESPNPVLALQALASSKEETGIQEYQQPISANGRKEIATNTIFRGENIKKWHSTPRITGSKKGYFYETDKSNDATHICSFLRKKLRRAEITDINIRQERGAVVVECSAIQLDDLAKACDVNGFGAHIARFTEGTEAWKRATAETIKRQYNRHASLGRGIFEGYNKWRWYLLPEQEGKGYFYEADYANQVSRIIKTLHAIDIIGIEISIYHKGGAIIVKGLAELLAELAEACGAEGFSACIADIKAAPDVWERAIKARTLAVQYGACGKGRFERKNIEQWHRLPEQEGEGYFHEADNYDQAISIATALQKAGTGIAISINKSAVVVEGSAAQLQQLAEACGANEFGAYIAGFTEDQVAWDRALSVKQPPAVKDYGQQGTHGNAIGEWHPLPQGRSGYFKEATTGALATFMIDQFRSFVQNIPGIIIHIGKKDEKGKRIVVEGSVSDLNAFAYYHNERMKHKIPIIAEESAVAMAGPAEAVSAGAGEGAGAANIPHTQLTSAVSVSRCSTPHVNAIRSPLSA